MKLTWPLAVPFLLLSRPSVGLLLVGGAAAVVGLLLRGWAAGSILKDSFLAMGGPYGHLRHPLYAGSFLVGLGLAVAGGRWFFLPVFLALFTWIYGRTIRYEERSLVSRFGEDYMDYIAHVPPLLPCLRPYVPAGLAPEGFRLDLYLRNKEWQAALGVAVGFGILWIEALFFL